MLGRYCADLGQGAMLLYGSGRCVSIGRLTSFLLNAQNTVAGPYRGWDGEERYMTTYAKALSIRKIIPALTDQCDRLWMLAVPYKFNRSAEPVVTSGVTSRRVFVSDTEMAAQMQQVDCRMTDPWLTSLMHTRVARLWLQQVDCEMADS